MNNTLSSVVAVVVLLADASVTDETMTSLMLLSVLIELLSLNKLAMACCSLISLKKLSHSEANISSTLLSVIVVSRTYCSNVMRT